MPWLWGVGLIFGIVVAIGILRWGSRHWRDVALAVAGTATSFAIALKILKAQGLTEPDWQNFPHLTETMSQARLDHGTLGLSAIAGLLFVLGMMTSYRPRRAIYRGVIWLLAIVLGLASAISLEGLQIFLANDHVVAVSLLCVLAGAVFTAGTALACKPQRGKFHGFSVATGAVCVGLLMPICFAVFLFVLKHHSDTVTNGPLMYALGMLWFAAFGAQLGYCFRYYVPEHRPWTPHAEKRAVAQG
jgi:hypothetical protein